MLTVAGFPAATDTISPLSKARQPEKGVNDMPGFRSNDEEEEEEGSLFDDVVRMADRLGIQGEKRSNYIDDHMTEAGYERIQSRESYAKVRQQDEEDESGGSRWFSGGRGRESRNAAQGRKPPGQRRDDSDSF